MPIETNLNTTPYFDDYDEDKQFHRVLFRPGVALQARELTQLQSILQNQIERFGNNIYLKGTIISGCTLSADYAYNYIKILDLQENGAPVSLQSYTEKIGIQEASGLKASIVNYVSGFQTSNPDLNTLYVKYLNTGSSGEKVFAADQVIKIYSPTLPIESISIATGGTGYSNSDIVVIYGTSGTGATATITTNSLGKIIDISMTNGGTSYSTVPGVYITSSATAGSITVIGAYTTTGGITGYPSSHSGSIGDGYIVGGSTLYIWSGTAWVKSDGSGAIFTALNYNAQIRVASDSFTAPVGVGAAIKTSRGIIYQKGNFIQVNEQTALLQKYTTYVDNKVVGFYTNESIVNSNIDSTLLDIATGTPNFAAPGANRLKLNPTLSVLSADAASANNDYLPLLEFQLGNIVKDRTSTQFNSVNKELAKRTFEESGNYVLEAFSLDTSTVPTSNATVNNSNYFTTVLSPGTAYVSGERVNLLNTTKALVRKGLDTITVPNQYINTSYGNYVIVNELQGNFDVRAGTTVSLKSAAATSLTLNTGTIPSPGVTVGTAVIRSIEYMAGTPGTPAATYKLYLFNINMQAGRSFKDVKAAHITSTAVADIVLVGSPAIAVLNDTERDTLVFNTGSYAVQQLTSTQFIYRTSSTTSIGVTGSVSFTVSGESTSLPYGVGALGSTDKQDFIVIPTTAFRFNANNAGTVTVADASTTMVVGSGASFTTSYVAGDYISINNVVRRINRIINNDSLELTAAYGTTVSSGIAHFTAFPALTPIDFTRAGRSITVASTTSFTLNIGAAINTATNITIYHNLLVVNAPIKTKTLVANVHVKLSTSLITASTVGPWCLGIPDVLSVEGVYIGSGSYATDDTTNFVNDFVLNNGQKNNIYGLAYLSKKPGSTVTLTGANQLVVKVKAFQISDGRYASALSYPVDDASATLPSNKIRTQTIPIYISPSSGEAISLRDAIDFRPHVSNTAVLATVLASASIDPSSTETLVASADKYFPAPSESFQGSVVSYLSRIDRINLTQQGQMKIVEGAPANNPLPPPVDTGCMDLGLLNVAPFPSLPSKVASAAGRPDLKNSIRQSQTRRYTMSDISSLDKRIQRLEYYTALNTIEAKTKNLTLTSEANTSLERFKNGFFVDPLNDYSISNLNDGEFKALIDLDRTRLTPQQIITPIDLKYSATGSTNVVKNLDLITLPYTSEVLVSQPHANKERTLVTGFWSFVGKMTVVPRVDNFFDTQVTSTSVIDINIADPLRALTDTVNQTLGAINLTPNAIKTTSSGVSLTGTQYSNPDAWTVRTTQNFAETLTTTLGVKNNQITVAPTVTTTQDVGSYLKSVNINTYIKAQRICMHVAGLRPGAQHWVFFDGIDVTDRCSQADLISNITDPNKASVDNFNPRTNKNTGAGSLFADSTTGILSIILYLPNDTFASGEKTVLVMDVSSLASETSATSKSTGKFSSFGISGTSGNITASTKTFNTTSGSPFANKTIDSTEVLNTTTNRWSTSTQVSNYPPPPPPPPPGVGPMGGRGGPDPLAQTFYIQAQGQVEYVHLTSIDIYFKAKDANLGVSLDIREVSDSGDVLPYILGFGSVYLPSASVSVDSTQASVATTFTFSSPLLVKAGREYAIVLTPDGGSPDYRVWTAIPGIADVLNPTLTPNKTWGDGTLFYSTSNRAFTAIQDEDIKFRVNYAMFTQVSGTAVLTNDDSEYLTITNTSGSFNGGEDVAQYANSFLNTTITTNSACNVILTGSSLTSVLAPGTSILIAYGTANTIGPGTVQSAGLTITNATSTSTSFITTMNFTSGSFIRIGNEIRQVIAVNSENSLTIDVPLNTAAASNNHYTVVSKFDVLKVQAVTSSQITVNRPPSYTTSSILAASIQQAVSGKVKYFDPTAGALHIRDSNAANSIFKILPANSTYKALMVGDRSDARASVSSIGSIEVLSFTPFINVINPTGTSVTQTLNLTKSSSGTTTSVSFPLAGKTDLDINDTAIVKSKSNEISGTTLTKSLTCTFTLGAAAYATSPILDDSPASLVSSRYLINNSYANENTRYGNAMCKYISKRIVLADGMDAEDIKVYISAYKPVGSEVIVYAKILNTSDTEDFVNKDWTILSQVTESSLFSSTSDESDVKEYEYTFPSTPPSIIIGGAITATTACNVVTGLNTVFNTDLTVDSIVKIVRSSPTTDYFISTVNAISSGTSLILDSPVTFSSTAAATTITGLTMERVTTPQAAFKYNQNANIVKYYSAAQQEMDSYKYMAIKVVLLSSSTFTIPNVNDIRAIAVSV